MTIMIADTTNVVLTNERYGITGSFTIHTDIWQKHLSMHPKRPEEVLQHNLAVCYGINVTHLTPNMIETVIEDEYKEALALPKIIDKARDIINRNWYL